HLRFLAVDNGDDDGQAIGWQRPACVVLVAHRDPQVSRSRRGLERRGTGGAQHRRRIRVLLGPRDERRGDPQGSWQGRQRGAKGEGLWVGRQREHGQRAAASLSVAFVHAKGPELAQGLAQAPRIYDSRLVVLEKLPPARGVGGVVVGPDRGQDGNPDGVGYL